MRPALLLLALPLALNAQRPYSPRPGAVVRVHRLTDRGDTVTVVGRLRAIDDDSISVRPKGPDSTTVLALGRGEVVALDLERGAKLESQWITAFGIAGAVTGGLVALKWCSDNPDACAAEQRAAERSERCGDTTGVWSTTTLLLVGGAVAGGLLGYAIGPHRYWQPIVLPFRAPGQDGNGQWGMRLGLSFPWPRSRDGGE